MQKKNWKKLDELIGKCYLSMIGQYDDENIWNKTFDKFIACIQKEREVNVNFGIELYRIDDETDYICDISGWLEDFYDALDMDEDYERIVDVSNQLLELFSWEDESKSEVYHRKASALSRLGRHDEALRLCESWYAKEADNPVAAASLIYSYMGNKDVKNAEKIVGMVSLYAHSKETISIGVETFRKYRNCGYGMKAVELVLLEAKNKGYKIATAQVRCDNLPSIAICNKAGFENNHSYVNKKGNKVYFFIKSLV